MAHLNGVERRALVKESEKGPTLAKWTKQGTVPLDEALKIAYQIALLLIAVVLSLTAEVNPTGTISTFAGNGTPGFSGDKGAATRASLSEPFGLAVDRAGNLYIADTSNHRIRKVDASGIIVTVAGSEIAGFSGDGGLATSARLNAPTGVAVDRAGNLYIADTYNNRIRKVNTAGIITTAAGNGEARFSGDNIVATGTSLFAPFGLAVDRAGDLYIADTSNQRIRKVSAAGVITTVAGNGIEGFSGDGGAAVRASLDFPTGVVVDDAGNLLITDQSNHRIRKVNTAGIISTIAGNGSDNFSGDDAAATKASLNLPVGAAVDAVGNLYIADSSNHRIRTVNSAGIIMTVAGNGIGGFSGDGGAAVSASLSSPGGVAEDAAGNLYIADTLNNRIRKVNAAP